MRGENRPTLAGRRRARGHTQESLAERLDIAVSTVARWERGTTTPSAGIRRALADELGVSLDELAALLDHDTDATRTADANPWPAVPPQPRGRIGHDTLDRLAIRVDSLRGADDMLGGGDLHQLVRADLAAMSQLRHTSHTESVRRRLLSLTADLSQLAAWSTADAGFDQAAVGYYAHGMRAARAADDDVTVAHLRSSLAYHYAENGMRTRYAVRLARDALDQAGAAERPVTPTTWALLYARLAWSHVSDGDPRAAIEALNRARERFAQRTERDPDPPWTYWLTAEEMDVIVGRALAATGALDSGRRLLGDALGRCDPRHVRERTLYTCWLARTHARTGEWARARALAEDARRLDAAINSAYSRRAVAHLADLR